MSIFFISSWIERLVFSATFRLHFQQNRFISTVRIFLRIRLKHGVWLFTRRFIPTKLVNEIVSEIRLGVCLNCRQTMLLLSIDQAASRIPARRIWLYHCLTWKLFCVDVYSAYADALEGRLDVHLNAWFFSLKCTLSAPPSLILMPILRIEIWIERRCSLCSS